MGETKERHRVIAAELPEGGRGHRDAGSRHRPKGGRDPAFGQGERLVQPKAARPETDTVGDAERPETAQGGRRMAVAPGKRPRRPNL